MRVALRMTRAFVDRMIADLARPHPFALERVGFAFARLARASAETALVLPVEYHSLDDGHYVEDSAVATRIGTDAIRFAHQRALDSKLGCLHVHMHPGRGRSGPSPIDVETYSGLAPSLRRVARGAAHGGLVLSERSASALLWVPGLDGSLDSDVTIVGYPLVIERSDRS